MIDLFISLVWIRHGPHLYTSGLTWLQRSVHSTNIRTTNLTTDKATNRAAPVDIKNRLTSNNVQIMIEYILTRFMMRILRFLLSTYVFFPSSRLLFVMMKVFGGENTSHYKRIGWPPFICSPQF